MKNNRCIEAVEPTRTDLVYSAGPRHTLPPKVET
jgi:hypothetical protein